MSKDKAREFWITVDDHQCLDAYWREPGNTFQKFHVIEHSAYAALEAKLAECVRKLELYANSKTNISQDIARETLAKVKK